MVLEADASVAKIDLASAGLGLTVKRTNKIGYQVVTQSGLIPLVGFSKLQKPWGREPTFDASIKFATSTSDRSEFEDVARRSLSSSADEEGEKLVFSRLD